MAFPSAVSAGMRVGRLGSTSVRYEIALFQEGDAVAAAEGHFVHVYVDRATRPAPIPERMREALARL